MLYSYSLFLFYSLFTLFELIADILDTMIDDEISRFMKRPRFEYAPPTVLPVLVATPSPSLPIVHSNPPLLDEDEMAQICNENCSIDEDETYRIKDIMTRSPLPSLRFDDIDFDDLF